MVSVLSSAAPRVAAEAAATSAIVAMIAMPRRILMLASSSLRAWRCRTSLARSASVFKPRRAATARLDVLGRHSAFKKNPYPDIARGLIHYFMQPANYDKIIQSTGGRWVPVYKRLFDSPFWREKPDFKHFINMAETGVPVSYAGAPTPAAGEVLNTTGAGRWVGGGESARGV